MCARHIKILLFLLSFLPNLALARLTNFATRSPFGIGLVGGLESAPTSDFATTPQKFKTDYAHFFGIEPFWDMENFAIKPSVQIHYNPDISGAGSDTIGSFSESSNSKYLSYGITLELCPYISASQRQRFLLALGAGRANAFLTNTRNYKSKTYIEKLKGSTQYLRINSGIDFFLLQNYSLEISAGYQSLKFSELGYQSSRNVQGTLVNSGAAAKKSTGTKKELDGSGWTGAVSMNLHF